MTQADPDKRPTLEEIREQIQELSETVETIDAATPFYTMRSSRSLTFASRFKSDFQEIEFIGKGAFGSVMKVLNYIDGRNYAVKKIRLKGSENEQDKIIREVLTLSRLQHQNIVRYFTAWYLLFKSCWYLITSSGSKNQNPAN
jgi:hypothetical protein